MRPDSNTIVDLKGSFRLDRAVGVVVHPDTFLGSVFVPAFFSNLTVLMISNEGTMSMPSVGGAPGFTVGLFHRRVWAAIEFWKVRLRFLDVDDDGVMMMHHMACSPNIVAWSVDVAVAPLVPVPTVADMGTVRVVVGGLPMVCDVMPMHRAMDDAWSTVSSRMRCGPGCGGALARLP